MSGLTVIASRKARPVALKRLSAVVIVFSVENLEVEIHLNIEAKAWKNSSTSLCQNYLILDYRTSIKDQEATSRQV